MRTDKDIRSVATHSPAHQDPAEEKVQYQQAMRLLRGIDQKLSQPVGPAGQYWCVEVAKPLCEGTHDTSKVRVARLRCSQRFV
jgi:hypothetical protein